MYWSAPNMSVTIGNYQIRNDLEEFTGDIVKRTLDVQSMKTNVSAE